MQFLFSAIIGTLILVSCQSTSTATITNDKTMDSAKIELFCDQTDQESSCVKLVKPGNSPKSKQVRCNAIGTPAEGWYQAGKIIQHRPNCAEEVLSCGLYPTEGWYVQKKTNKLLGKSESCIWVRDNPVCQTLYQGTGWYLGTRLLVIDEACQKKVIECQQPKESAEGWYIYDRSNPKLLMAGNCLTNRDTVGLFH